MNRAAWRFFQQQAGGIVGQQAIGAWSLAQAEALGAALGWAVEWGPDCSPDMSWCRRCELADSDRRRHIKRPGPEHRHEVFVALLKDARGNILESLSGIDFGPFGEPGNPYKRVVEAELMLGAIFSA